ncbi:hypothetical protein [Terrisporobacter sp.]
MKFYKWYTQTLGCIAGMLCCIYCYVRGDLLLYHNLSGNFDALGLNQILASYILYPLCILTFFLILLVGLAPNCVEKRVLNIKIIKIINFLKYSLVIIGILGCGIYFVIPSLIILLSDIISHLNKSTNKMPEDKIPEESPIYPQKTTKEQQEEQLMITKNEIALHLLKKNSDINFIADITGFSIDYIENLEKKL